MPKPDIAKALTRTKKRVTLRSRQGLSRMRRAFLPLLVTAVASGFAFWLSQLVLGHEYPFFAPVAVFACLGFTHGRSVRRVAEIGVGVTLGVALGETFALVAGSARPTPLQPPGKATARLRARRPQEPPSSPANRRIGAC